jgi:hypothetical protein
VPELWHIPDAAKIRIYGRREVLDRLEAPEGVRAGRVAPDEILWLADPGRAAALEEQARTDLASEGLAAFAIDYSDGWTLFSIVGEGAEEVLARVSSLRVGGEGAGFFQGQVAQSPAKVFWRPGRIDVLVGSDLAWFVGERLRHAGAGAGLVVAEVPEREPVSNAARVTA